MVCDVLIIGGGMWARLPVKTTAPVPKDRVQEVCSAALVRLGDVVVSDILGTGADIVATRAMAAPRPPEP
jgi:CxxC motif-containing protein